MRQLFLAIAVSAITLQAASSGASVPAVATSTGNSNPNENKQVEAARAELKKVTALVEAGALARTKLDDAQQAVADAEDDAILQSTLYGDFPVQNLNEQVAESMIDAAQRRCDRQRAKIERAQKFVDDGITAATSLEPLRDELNMREVNLNLARSRAKLIGELASIARYEQNMQAIREVTKVDYRDFTFNSMAHFEGNGAFVEGKELKPLEAAFQKRFAHALPISADGQTGVHNSLGFDHRGRVDVALNPDDAQGIWLRRYLEARQIPYYAFRRAIPGKATGAHIHIGPGSLRLHSAD